MISTPLAAYGSISIHHDVDPPFAEEDLPVASETGRRSRQRRVELSLVAFFTATVVVVFVLGSSINRKTSLSPLQMNSLATINNDAMLSLAEFSDPSTKEHFFTQQLVDHHAVHGSKVFSQRYYQKANYFGGPGSPIFVIFGGEDPLENLLYPFVYDHLAKSFDGITYALEHRFFGESIPVPNATLEELHKLLTPDQALWDVVRFIQHKRHELGCSLDRNSLEYCPAITVGYVNEAIVIFYTNYYILVSHPCTSIPFFFSVSGSYPGMLSGLMRFVHSDVVDISYASSAPYNLYTHNVSPYAYYEYVTLIADQMSPGCSDAVRQTLLAAQDDMIHRDSRDLLELASEYGICRDSIPEYVSTGEILSQEVMVIIAEHFAEGNMMAYPPSNDLPFVQTCKLFQSSKTPVEKVSAYLAMSDEDANCFDFMTEVPPGPYAKVSGSDWSGVGSGPEGYFWEYLSCIWAPGCAMSPQSMFPPRIFNMTYVTEHCEQRFGVTPSAHGMNEEFHFDDRSTVTHLLLTNGIVDGWASSSILEEFPDAPGVRVVNMINGAHHTDLSHTGPTEKDTPDVKHAYVEITDIIGEWLNEIRTEPNRL